MASFELWRRQFEVTDRPIIDTPEKAVEQLSDIRTKKQEYFVCITLDGANRLIAKRLRETGEILGIQLLDHLIVTASDWDKL